MKTKNTRGWGASAGAPGFDRLISKREAADILGVSVRTVEREIAAGKLAKHSVRGSVRLSLAAVLGLAGIEKPSKAEIR